jgi:hypothetical protein
MMLLMSPAAVWAQNGGWGRGNGRGGDDNTGRQLFQWAGQVDREVQIVMRDNDVYTRASGWGNTENTRERSRVESRLPRADGYVSVRVLSGRGDVQVVQQPSYRNNYTTIVRIRDSYAGQDRYRIATYWESSNGYGTWGGNDRRSPRVESRDRDDDGDYDNGRYGQGNGDYGRGTNNRGSYGERGSLHWSGAVDGEVEIRLQGRSIDYQTLSGSRPMDVRTSVTGQPLGGSAGGVEIRANQGRGSVVVVQQPSAYNGYTAVVRVRDPEGGYGRYDFDVIWR